MDFRHSRFVQGLLCTVMTLAPALGPSPAIAAFAEPPRAGAEAKFYRQLQSALDGLKASEVPLMRELHAAVSAAPKSVSFRPITDDPATWHRDGDRNRGYTDPADGGKKSLGRSQPTDAVIYIPRIAVEPGSPRWKNGLLVHELVHALDLVEGRFHPSDPVRERRATFVQNVWRQHIGYPLRESYHGRFPTLDYQEAVSTGAVETYTRCIFTRNDLPYTAANDGPVPGRQTSAAKRGRSSANASD